MASFYKYLCSSRGVFYVAIQFFFSNVEFERLEHLGSQQFGFRSLVEPLTMKALVKGFLLGTCTSFLLELLNHQTLVAALADIGRLGKMT